MPISAYKRELRALAGHTLLMTAGVAALIHDDQGRLLLQERDDGRWGLPGGEIDPEEVPADALAREMWEEMGVHIAIDRLVGAYAGPDWHVVHANGDEDSVLDLVFRCRIAAGVLRPDGDEVLAVRYCTPEEAAALPVCPSDRRLLAHAWREEAGAHFDPPAWRPAPGAARTGGQSAYSIDLRRKVGSRLLITPAVGALVFDESGGLLLQQRADNGRWAPPAGALEPLESPADGVVRETWEETGVLVEPVRLTGIYGGPDFRFAYQGSGDEIAVLSLVFVCRPVGGAPSPDGNESLAVAYSPPEEIARPDFLSPLWQRRITDALSTGDAAYFDPPAWTPDASSG